jgi:uncharacterized protein (DUF58 family)
MLTTRGRRLLVLAALLYLVGWGFGTAEMFPVAVGLALAVGAAALWIRLVSRPMELRRRTGHLELVEGRPVTVDLDVRSDGGPLPGRATLTDRIGDLGERTTALERRGQALVGRYRIGAIPRGRYPMESAELHVSDPFGLAESRLHLVRTDTLLVYPRVVELEGLFTDTGNAGETTQALLHRTSGYDVHSIRDYQEGESLRRVHWRSTAKRRRLMVKELRDAPRDEAAVLLDCDRTAVAGEQPDWSFDVQVRAAASLLHRLAADGQRCSLVISNVGRTRVRIQGGGGEWITALGELAAVRPLADRPLARMLAETMTGSGGETLDAARVYVVTAAMTPALADRLRALRSARRDVAVVWVDLASFAGNGGAPPGAADGAALALARAGSALVRIRRGDDLGRALSAARLAVAANA